MAKKSMVKCDYCGYIGKVAMIGGVVSVCPCCEYHSGIHKIGYKDKTAEGNEVRSVKSD